MWAGILTLCTVGWAIGWTFSDRTWWTGLLSYFPSPVLVALLAIDGLLAVFRRNWRRSSAVLIVACWPLASIVFFENRLLTVPPLQPTRPSTNAEANVLRCVHWNVFEGALGWEPVLKALRDSDADLIALSDAPKTLDTAAFARDLGGEYEAVRVRELSVAVRGSIIDSEPVHLARQFGVLRVDCRTPLGDLRVLLADLPADPLVARAPNVRFLLEIIEDLAPDLVFGDFNAPRHSWSLRQLPTGYVHAYDVAGRGWSSTWPLPTPLYSIDQCLVGPTLEVLAFELQSSWGSDHRRQVVQLAVP